MIRVGISWLRAASLSLLLGSGCNRQRNATSCISSHASIIFSALTLSLRLVALVKLLLVLHSVLLSLSLLLQEEALSIQLHRGIIEWIIFATFCNSCPLMLILSLTSFLITLSIVSCPTYSFWRSSLANWLLIHDVDGKVPVATCVSARVSVQLVLGWRTSV